MADTQLPPVFPVNSFLGHPDRYYGAAGFNYQSMHQSPEGGPARLGHSQVYPILPPLRMCPTTSSSHQHSSSQAVPISKLLSDSPRSPPRTNLPLVPQYVHPAVSSPLPPIASSQHFHHPPPHHNVAPATFRTVEHYQPRSPASTVVRTGSFGKPNQSPHYTSRSPSLASADSIYSPGDPSSAASAKLERFNPQASPSPNVKYTLNMRQQPIAARACGFGERDRRVVDPPPIVDVALIDRESGVDEEETPHVYTTLHCTIVHADTLADASQIEQSRSDMAMTQRLMGTCVASPFSGKDEFGNRGTFFVFPDLSCRSPGKYRFLFRLIVVDPLHLEVGGSTKIQTQIYSDQFEVYSAKEFPGMRASSGLLKTLRKQGLNVAVKKGREATKKSTRRTQNEGDDSEDDEDMVEDADEDDVRDIKKRKRSA